MANDITLSKLGLRFDAAQERGGVQALDDISCAFAAGSFSVIVGASGCGKSTFLRVLAGLVRPTQGTLDMAKMPIGFVFQEPTLLDWRNVYDNIALPLKLGGCAKSEAEQRTQDALALVGLSGRARAMPHQLSGGMKMRVSLARALARRPRLLLMDEPFAALDELTRLRLEDDLRRLWRTIGCTIIFVTHSISEAAYLAERVLVLGAQGTLAADIAVPDHKDEKDFRMTRDFQTAYAAINDGLQAAYAPTHEAEI